MRRRNKLMNLFYIPAILLMLLFVVYPFFQTCKISFSKWNGYSSNISYIGLKNYINMFGDKKFWCAFGNTLLYGFGSTALQNILGLAFALLVNSRFRGNGVVRTIIYMPIIISGLIIGYIMYYFFTYDNGVLNDVIGWFGRAPVDWLAIPWVGRIAITLINSIQFTGTSMIIYLAGLQNIPQVYYEAAAIDGADKNQRFCNIVLPLLMPSISSAVIINLIGGLKLYDVVVSLTNGGPGNTTHSLMSYISNQYFLYEKAGYSAAIGIFTFLLIFLFSALGNRFFSSREVEM